MSQINYSSVDVAIIGGGPAGLAAATVLKSRGVGRVVILEREPEAGGIPRHCGHYPFGMREFHRLLRGPELARRLVQRAETAGVEIRTQTTVAALLDGPLLMVTSPVGVEHIKADRVIVATGVRETSRAGRLIGGTKPGGVLSTGALQSLVYLEGRQPFQRPLIVGSELVAFSALLTCCHAGIKPVAMIEERDRPTAWKASPFLPKVLGIPFQLRTQLRAIWGHKQVEAVDIEGPQGTDRLDVDGVVISGSFRPEASLFDAGPVLRDALTGGALVDQFGRTSGTGYFAAGNLLRPVETAGWSWQEGADVGGWVADDLESALPPAGIAVDIRPMHPALRFVMPQRFVPGVSRAGSLGMSALQLRVSRPVKGMLRAVECLPHAGGIGPTEDRVLWSGSLSALPERRILIPTQPLQGVRSGAWLEIRLDEQGNG